MQLSSTIQGALLALILSSTLGLLNYFDKNINFTFISFIYYFILSAVGYIIAVTYLKFSSKLPLKIKYFSHIVSYLVVIIASAQLELGNIVASGELCVICAFIVTLLNDVTLNSRYNKHLKRDC